jgi:penicillin-binding protein 1A
LLYEGELRVYTHIDLKLQASMERALETRLHEIESTYTLPFERDRSDSLGPGETPRYLQGAALALDPRTGAILGMVGGRSFQDSRFNRAVQARRQPGSCFKPFVYTAAIQAHKTPADIILDTPLVIDIGYGLGLCR